MTDTINDILSGGAFTRQQADALRLLLGLAATDSNTVHKTGDESIAGNKTFTGKTRMIGGDDTLYIGPADRPSAYGFTGSAYFVLDKNSEFDDASFVLRDNGNARAEIGLVTTNDIHFKTVTGTYLSEVFTDRLIIKASGFVDAVNSVLRVNSATGTPSMIVGNSDGATAGAAIEVTYDQTNTQGWIRCVERGNTYRKLLIESNGIDFYQGGGSTALVASLSAAGVFQSSTLVSGSTVRTAGYTVATLPTGTVGDRAYVTDAVAPTWNGALTGGGSVTVPVFRGPAGWVSA